MAKEIYLKPTDFQKEVDEYRNSYMLAEGVKYSDENDSNKLDGRELMSDCVNTMNQLVSKLMVNGEREVRNLQNIKSSWMNVDEEAGDMLVSEAIFGKK